VRRVTENMMDQDKRAQFIADIRERNARSLDAAREALDERFLTGPLEDKHARWRADAEAATRQREAAQAELRREAERERDRRRPPSIDWRVIDERISALIEAEKRFIFDAVGEALGEFVGRETQALRAGIAALKSELTRLRRDIDGVTRALESARADDGRLAGAIEAARASSAVLTNRIGSLERDVDRALARKADAKVNEKLDAMKESIDNVVRLHDAAG
jgi:hypothetical protein